MKLNWVYDDLKTLNKEDIDYNGVYIIYYTINKNPLILKVGSGNLKERLSKHADKSQDFNTKLKEFNTKLKKFNSKYNISFDIDKASVVFAKVDGKQMKGVEKYIGNKIDKDNIVVAERFPDEVEEIKVELPFQSILKVSCLIKK